MSGLKQIKLKEITDSQGRKWETIKMGGQGMRRREWWARPVGSVEDFKSFGVTIEERDRCIEMAPEQWIFDTFFPPQPGEFGA